MRAENGKQELKAIVNQSALKLNNNDRIFVSVDENEFSHFFELISKVYPGVLQVFDERSKELLNN